MQTLTSRPPVPTYPFEPAEATGSRSFSLVRSAGETPYEADVLLPHRKAYYMLVFFLLTTGYALARGHVGWAGLLTLLNVGYNLYPIWLQQYLRIRLGRLPR